MTIPLLSQSDDAGDPLATCFGLFFELSAMPLLYCSGS